MEWLRRLFGGGRDDEKLRTSPGRWEREDEEHRAGKQQADPGALEVEGDPRGGLQDEEYRTADPRHLVESEGAAMMGPAGAALEDATPHERRERDREDS